MEQGVISEPPPAPRPVVVLHERLGVWARRLRTRLDGGRISWVETRTTAELMDAVAGVASALVLVEVGPDPGPALRDLAELQSRGSAPLVLVVDPEDRPAVRALAEEFGAAMVARPGASPPEVAAWLAGWIDLAAARIAREGWTRAPAADLLRDPAAWLAARES